uniref:Lysosome-associated membrane glycoprotein 2 n=1 Tax=Callorhinchus milii TaxID=7868 RepID=V9KKC9_CALMI
MHRSSGLCLILLVALGFSLSEAVTIELRDTSGQVCLYAALSVNFTVRYEGIETMVNASFQLPSEVSTNGSLCGDDKTAPLINMTFGTGHSLSLNFSHSTGTFRGDFLTLTYNTSDSTLFPGAQNASVQHVTIHALMMPVPLNTLYTCKSVEAVAEGLVTMVFWNVSIQAFVKNGTISTNETSCKEDQPTTVAPVTTQSPTKPPTTPPPLEKPTVGNYSVKNGSDSCLLANFGLQLNQSFEEGNQTKFFVHNIDPHSNATGQCGKHDATLVLKDSVAIIQFHFRVDNSKFFLNEVKANVSFVVNGTESVHADTNGNLSYWHASLGSSYLCNKEQRLSVSVNLTINTFNVWVQPFQLKGENFSKAEQCFLDDDGILIPIVVGAALAGLIVIVVIAYVIGRRKSYAGYQTL